MITRHKCITIQQASRHVGGLLVFALVLASLTACGTTPATPAPTETPTAIPPATPAPSPTATGAAKQPAGQVRQAIMADWEDMFRTTNSYEYASTQGQPGQKEWWIEQVNRFYTGKALADWLEQIEFMFSPRSVGNAPGFIENARYTLEVEGCSSDTECTLKVHVESGQMWAYEVHYKQWHEASPIEQPFDWTIAMQYDPAAGHWKIK